jgi:serine/threonine protein kinase
MPGDDHIKRCHTIIQQQRIHYSTTIVLSRQRKFSPSDEYAILFFNPLSHFLKAVPHERATRNRGEVSRRASHWAGRQRAGFYGIDLDSGEPVAIKALRSQVIEQNPNLLERFRREGEALHELNHPNIVKMLAAFEDDGQHYLVMEYVGGGSLYELLKQQGRLPIERVLYIALDLSDALTRAHRLKIIHRDIKPANILLASDGTPRLTDFGAARLTKLEQLTREGGVVGTVSYLSPKVYGETVDARADIWSFGILLFEMLTGQRPSTGAKPWQPCCLLSKNHYPIWSRSGRKPRLNWSA